MCEILKLFYYGNDSNLFSSAAQESCKKDESAKHYAQAQASGELDFEELCEGITSPVYLYGDRCACRHFGYSLWGEACVWKQEE